MASRTETKRFDAIVIGSGQAGTPLASALAQSGKKTALIEKAHVGGSCVNEGCTPTKTMVASARVAHLANRASDYGIWNTSIEKSEKSSKAHGAQDEEGRNQINVVTDMLKVRQRKRDIVDKFRSGSEARVHKQENLDLIVGEAAFEDANRLKVKLEDGGELHVATETIFINTGERPARPQLPGLDSIDPARVLDSTSIMELGEVPDHLIVIGGGYIGLEFGQLFRRLGSQVTVVQRSKQLAPREDFEIADALREILEGEGIKIMLNTGVASLKSDDSKAGDRGVMVFYQDQQGRKSAINGSHLLMAAGREPNTDMLNLDAAGVKMDSKGRIPVNAQLQTNIPHIYALGDVKGGPAFTHVSYDDFRIVRSNLVSPSPPKPPATTADRLIAYCMFTGPQLGHVGLHEHEARAIYPEANIKTATMPMAYVARALETNETRGMMKAVVNADTGLILGFTCLGIEGGEVMSIVQTAMMGKLPYTTLQNAIFAHPTLAESLNNIWGFLE